MKIAIVGYGGMGNFHREFMIPNSKFELAGIFDIDDKANKAALKSGIYVYSDIDEIIDDKDVKLVLIATPNDFHYLIAKKLLLAKKHVLCEKPATMNIEDLKELIKISKENNILFSVNQNRRYDNDFLSAKKIIESNELGEVFHFESKVFGSRGIPGDWRKVKAQGGGMLFDWGIHLIDQVTLIGGLEIESMFVEFIHLTNFEVDEGFRVHFRFTNNSTALVEVSTCSFIEQPRWTIFGTNGTAIIGDYNNQWKEEVKIKSLTNFEKIEVKPVKAANGFTKTMAPRKEDEEIEVYSRGLELGDPIEIYDSIFESILNNKCESIITHESLIRTFELIGASFISGEENKIIRF